MKTFLQKMWMMGVVALLSFNMLGSQAAEARPGDRVSFQTFYDELSPYGRWINDPEFGYVWAPRVEAGFQPYATRGHWVMTEYGNTWVSDYDWGWAAFHYGRWMYDDFYGWLWVPGNEWGPAWVDWRHSNDYYGWAPMGPRVTYVVPVTRWVFVPVMYITSPRIYSYCLPRTRVVNIYHHTTIINNYYERDNRKYVYGPRNQDIERATNRKVNVHRLENDSRPGRNVVADNSIRIYRPEVDSRRTEVPSKVEARNNAAPRTRFTSEGNTSTSRTDRTSTVGRTSATDSQPAGGIRSRSQDTRTDNTSPVAQPTRETSPQPSRRERSVSSPGATSEGRSVEPMRRSAPRTREEATPVSPGMRETTAPATRTRQTPTRMESSSESRPSAPIRTDSPSTPTRSRAESMERSQPLPRTRTQAAPAPSQASPAAPASAPVREGGRRSRN